MEQKLLRMKEIAEQKEYAKWGLQIDSFDIK